MSDIALIGGNLGVQTKREEEGSGLPVGPLRLVSVLEEHGISVDFKDYQTQKIPQKVSENTFSKFIDVNHDVIGISVYCGALPTVLGGIQKLKEEKPDKLVILGGPSATDTPSEILENFPVDIIVIGEGELTIVDLMKALDGEKDLREVPGIAYRENGRIIINPRRERIKDLDSLPFPAYHKIDFKDYGYQGALMTTRGCPYTCAFCSVHSVWERQITSRSIENVVEELHFIEDRIKGFYFYDDTFVLNPKRVIALLTRMKEEKIDLPWSGYGRVNLMSSELLETMSNNGCREIFYGVESGSDSILKKINKKFTIKKALEVTEKTLPYIKRVITSYIWGYPFETMDDFYDTLMAMFQQEQMRGVIPRLVLLSPLPKSPLYQEYGSLIAFPEEVETARLGSLPAGEKLSEYPYILRLVKSHPEIFSSFYYFSHNLFKQKMAVIQKIEREKEKKRKTEEKREVEKRENRRNVL